MTTNQNEEISLPEFKHKVLDYLNDFNKQWEESTQAAKKENQEKFWPQTLNENEWFEQFISFLEQKNG